MCVPVVASAMPVGPAVSTIAPPADHYLTHLRKHPWCKACMDCEVQRKHCRDNNKKRQKTNTEITTTTTVDIEVGDFEEMGDPKQNFGDLVASDSGFAIKRNSTS